MEYKSIREVMLQEHDIELRQIRNRVEILETMVNKLCAECKRLYNMGYVKGVDVALKEANREFQFNEYTLRKLYEAMGIKYTLNKKPFTKLNIWKELKEGSENE